MVDKAASSQKGNGPSIYTMSVANVRAIPPLVRGQVLITGVAQMTVFCLRRQGRGQRCIHNKYQLRSVPDMPGPLEALYDQH